MFIYIFLLFLINIRYKSIQNKIIFWQKILKHALIDLNKIKNKLIYSVTYIKFLLQQHSGISKDKRMQIT